MAKLKGIVDMSAGLPVVKGKDNTEATPTVVRAPKVKKEKRWNRVGYGKYSATVLMTDGAIFAKVPRQEIEKQQSLGWKCVSRSIYKAALAKGAQVAAAPAEVKRKRKNKVARDKQKAKVVAKADK